MDNAPTGNKVTTAQLRHDLGEILGKAHHRGTVTHVSRHGKPFAAVVSHDDGKMITEIKATMTPSRWRELADALEQAANNKKSAERA